MNREQRQIKFRAISIVTKKWVYGDCISINGKHYINPQPFEFIDDFRGVKPETVGQFTGLIDKNGKEIYEHDIESYGLVVTWHKGGFVFPISGSHSYIPLHEANNLEIIGNLHQSPELLK